MRSWPIGGGILARSLFWGLLWSSLLGLILVLDLLPSRVELSVGDVSHMDFRAPRRITFISQVLTEEERQRAEASIPAVYDPADPRVLREQMQRAQQLFAFIDSVRQDEEATLEAKVQRVSRLQGSIIPEPMIAQALRLEEDAWREVVTETLLVLDRLMRTDIRPEQVEEARGQIPSQISLSLTPFQAQLVEAFAAPLVAPNSFHNVELTEAARAEARASVQSVRRTIERGEIIVREGDRITPLAWEALGELGLRQVSIAWPQVVANLLFVLMLVSVLLFYLYRRRPAILNDRRHLLILTLLLSLSFLGAKLMVPGQALLGHLFPLAASSMLLASLIDVELALLVSALLSLSVGLMAGGSLELAVYGFLGGALSALRLQRLDRLNAFLWAGLLVSLSNLAVALIFSLLERAGDLTSTLQLLAVAVANGGLSASLTLGGFFVLTNFFNIITPLQLLELARPSHPLLRELLLKAPGTYHHSLMVGNLAEQAAQAIGADPLLVRVGAYYHDVGKILRPYLFVENQHDGVNIHDNLDPKTSAQMVVAHVEDGLDLAKRYSLPRVICDFIPQHHGTLTASYFYRQAQERANDEVVIGDFVYAGPRPQSREAGILMLADGVEATVRAEHPTDREEIER
ncbi:MAG: HDIG domain-containing protein, partial [Chloroflexi bacterium]|nr:HDIG domain-containing protein [Chloroflexota bacterium]